jgi:hypothetical protein
VPQELLVENNGVTWEAYINVDLDAPPREDLNQTTPTKDGSDGTVYEDADLDKVLSCGADVCDSAATVPVVIKERHKSHQRPSRVQSKTARRGVMKVPEKSVE